MVLLCRVSEAGTLTQIQILVSLRSELFSSLYFVISSYFQSSSACSTHSCVGQETLQDYSQSKKTESWGTSSVSVPEGSHWDAWLLYARVQSSLLWVLAS